MAKRRRNRSFVQQDEDTSDLNFFSNCSESSPEKPVQRNAANARERARMRVLSKAFCRLKTSLPWVPSDTKLSKLDTLRLAATYIAHLRKILREDSGDNDLYTRECNNTREGSTHPATLTWPFSINSRSNHGDFTPASQENVRYSGDCSQDGLLDYRNFVPCEYLAMDQSNCQRRNSVRHYLQ